MPIEVTLKSVGENQDYPQVGNRVTVNYTIFVNGNKLDSSIDRNFPLTFEIGRSTVIPAFEEALLKMNVGSKAYVKCTSDLAYGETGIPGVLAANQDLEFEI